MPSKRERYEKANMRGGLGVRKRLSEESLRDSYRLNGVQKGSVVVRAWDKYRGDFSKGFDVGILVRRSAATVYIHWAGDEDYTVYQQGDARYEVDRGRWKFLGLMGPNPLDPNDAISIALTKLREAVRMDSWEPVESVKAKSQSQSSESDPTANARPSAVSAKTSTKGNTTESGEKRTQKLRKNKNSDDDSRSTESHQEKSKPSGKPKANDVQSADGRKSRQSTTAMPPASGEDYFVETATSDSDSSETTQNASEPPQHILRGQLTRGKKSIRIPVSASPDNPTPTTDGVDETEEEDDDMAERLSKAAAERAAAQKQLEAGDLKDRETYTAKQVATRLGTDAKTMRKFFRSKNSTVEPVGQGGRYEFAATDLPKIRREFDAWQTKAKTARQKPKPSVPITEVMDKAKDEYLKSKEEVDPETDDPYDERDHEADLEQAVKDHFGEDHEPTPEELEEMERIMELDLDED